MLERSLAKTLTQRSKTYKSIIKKKNICYFFYFLFINKCLLLNEGCADGFVNYSMYNVNNALITDYLHYRYRLRASSCPDIYRNSMTTIAREKVQWYAGLWDFWDLLVDIFDFSHFSDPKFLVFAISNFLLYTWYDVPYVYLTDNARKNGCSDKDASLLISIIGIINMIGEVSRLFAQLGMILLFAVFLLLDKTSR